jgi:hypothetical protein
MDFEYQFKYFEVVLSFFNRSISMFAMGHRQRVKLNCLAVDKQAWMDRDNLWVDRVSFWLNPISTWILDFRVYAAIFDHTTCGAHFPPHTSMALGFATQHCNHADVRDSNSKQGKTQDMEATWANIFYGRSAKIATRPDWKATLPHGLKFPFRLSPPSYDFIWQAATQDV